MRNCYAACGWRKSWPRKMEEDGAAAIAAARTDIPVKNNDDVIKSVIPQHPFMACGVGHLDRAIVISVVRNLAPAEIGVDRVQGQPRLEPEAAASNVAE